MDERGKMMKKEAAPNWICYFIVVLYSNLEKPNTNPEGIIIIIIIINKGREIQSNLMISLGCIEAINAAKQKQKVKGKVGNPQVIERTFQNPDFTLKPQEKKYFFDVHFMVVEQKKVVRFPEKSATREGPFSPRESKSMWSYHATKSTRVALKYAGIVVTH